MASQYSKGRRHEENLVRLLKSLGLMAERVPLSGRWREDKADIIIYNNGTPLYASVKYGKQVPVAFYRANKIIFGPIECIDFPFLGGDELFIEKPPKIAIRELCTCPLFFAKAPKKTWKLLFRTDFEKEVCSALKICQTPLQ